MSDLEIRAERDYDYFGKREVVRLRWRVAGSRSRWNKRIIVPDDDHSLGEIMNRRAEYVAAIIAADKRLGGQATAIAPLPAGAEGDET